jgi:hypothetical protein
MPSLTVRNLTADFVEQFSHKALSNDWGPTRLLKQLMEDYISGLIAPSVPAPEQRGGRRA